MGFRLRFSPTNQSSDIIFNLHFPMVFLWFSYGFPMVFPWFSVKLWQIHQPAQFAPECRHRADSATDATGTTAASPHIQAMATVHLKHGQFAHAMHMVPWSLKYMKLCICHYICQRSICQRSCHINAMMHVDTCKFWYKLTTKLQCFWWSVLRN